MTPHEVLDIARTELRATGIAADRLWFSHAVFLPSGNASAVDGDRWLVYFRSSEPPAGALGDYDWVTVAVDDRTNQAHII